LRSGATCVYDPPIARTSQGQAEPPPSPSLTSSARLLPLDWLRGIVMVLMTVDHASEIFNAGRLMTDSRALYEPGTALPTAQFLTRWMTHVCAPSFVFLAGAALALSVERRRSVGEPARITDRFIFTRGAMIAVLDPLWMSWALAPGRLLLQVLYAIGFGLMAMVPLRRLTDRRVFGTALFLLLGGEALTGLAFVVVGSTPTLPIALVLTGGQFGWLLVAYPILPWLAVMLLGWCFGRYCARQPAVAIERLLVTSGLGALGVFVLVRGLNSYGNMLLLRDDGSLVQWLHVSKYPPSLAYMTLELGLMALCLATLFRLQRRLPVVASRLHPLLVLGQTALFYYLLHVHLLRLVGWGLGLHHRGDLAATYAAALGTVMALYPLCARYRRYKQAHPRGWTRYL
jgi:uncharacterized membrane protein